MTDPIIEGLAKAVARSRPAVRAVDAQHPALVEAGYALKAVAQWRSLDQPPAQRPSVFRELVLAAEVISEVIEDKALTVALDAARIDSAGNGVVIPFPGR